MRLGVDVVAVWLGLGFCSTWASSPTPAVITAWIETTISQHHPKDRPEDWRHLGSAAVPILIQRLQSETEFGKRQRLLGGLAHFSDPRAVQFLKQLAEDKQTDAQSIRSVLQGFEVSHPEEWSWSVQFLEHADPDVRGMAARNLRAAKNPEAQVRYQEWKSKEKTTWLVAKVEGTLLANAGSSLGRLRMVASSEDNEWKDWSGEWRGSLLREKVRGIGQSPAHIGSLGAAEKGLATQELAELSLTVGDAGGKVVLKGKGFVPDLEWIALRYRERLLLGEAVGPADFGISTHGKLKLSPVSRSIGIRIQSFRTEHRRWLTVYWPEWDLAGVFYEPVVSGKGP